MFFPQRLGIGDLPLIRGLESILYTRQAKTDRCHRAEHFTFIMQKQWQQAPQGSLWTLSTLLRGQGRLHPSFLPKPPWSREASGSDKHNHYIKP